MSEIPHDDALVRAFACEVMFRGRRRCRQSEPSGGARRDRTDDLMLAKHALSQLSYGPVPEDEGKSRLPTRPAAAAERRRLVGLGRLELPTSRLSSARSNQLSYKPLRRGASRIHPRKRMDDTAQPLARVRPRRKRNEDGGVPPMQLNDLAMRWPLMFLKRSDSQHEAELKDHP